MTREDGFYWVNVKEWIRGNPTIAEWFEGSWLVCGIDFPFKDDAIEVIDASRLEPPK